MIIPLVVNAVELYPQQYSSIQTPHWIAQEVYVRDNNLFVQFRGKIIIDNTDNKQTGWFTFYFKPTRSQSEYEEGYSSSIYIDNGSDEIIPLSPDKDYVVNPYKKGFLYNISLKNKEGMFDLWFKSNFTLVGSVKKLRPDDTYYSFNYLSSIPSTYQEVVILFPKKFSIIQQPDKSQSYVENYQVFRFSNENSKDYLNFIYQNIEEQKEKESKLNLDNLIMGAILGAILGGGVSILCGLGLDYLRREHTLCKEAKIEKFKNHERLSIKIEKIKNKNKHQQKN